MSDIRLTLAIVPVRYRDGRVGKARSEGNNAAWPCACGNESPLLGRCYFQFGHICHTVCPDCGRTYRVVGDSKKRAKEVQEE